jgi:hypothetical protein
MGEVARNVTIVGILFFSCYHHYLFSKPKLLQSMHVVVTDSFHRAPGLQILNPSSILPKQTLDGAQLRSLIQLAFLEISQQ